MIVLINIKVGKMKDDFKLILLGVIIGMIIGFYPSLNLTVENALWMCILICTIPFNLVKNILVVAVTFILYKRLGSFIKYIEKKAKIDNSYVEANPYSIISIISFIIVVFAFIGSVIRFINKDAVIGFILLAVAVVFITIGILVNKLKEKRKLEN